MTFVQQPLSILLSAYACEPNKGSEPAVGWNWVVELTKLKHQVCVITRENNREAIEAVVSNDPSLQGVRFVYFDLGLALRRWKKLPGGIQLYYLMWQIGVARLAKQLAQATHFDVVHHVTFVGLRQPSFLGGLGMPFIFGPVAGGERTPFALRRHFGWRAWWADLLRDIANVVTYADPMVRSCMRQAARIYVTSEQTRKLVPSAYQHKTEVSLAIGLSQKELDDAAKKKSRYAPDRSNILRVLFVGQFLELKGMGLGLRAFAELHAAFPGARLTMVGRGPAERIWKILAEKLGISQCIEWRPWVPREKILDVYLEHDVFLFPSLRDSGGLVVLEAMACGLPVVCVDIGGPAVSVDASCGVCVPVESKSESEVITGLAAALKCLASTQNRSQLSLGALRRAQQFKSGRLAEAVYSSLESGADLVRPKSQ